MGNRVLKAGMAVLAVGLIAGCAATTTTTGAAAAAAKPSSSASAASTAVTERVVSTAQGLAATLHGATTEAAGVASAAASVTVTEGICTAPAAYKALAARLSTNIQQALHGQPGDQAVTVYDQVTGVSCAVNATRHFSSASIVKTIILAALLRWHQETGEPLSSTEQYEATLMITQSDDDAATYLWDEVGMDRLQDFLDAAKMNETELGQDGYWGLTQVTAHDEMLLLKLLDAPNSVLDNASRGYELGLMAQVISSQRWGTPYGAPADVTVHVKNGWLPDPLWHINSLGIFTGSGKNYMMAVLTDDNPTEQDGIDTVQDVASVVHRDINEAQPKA